MKKRERERDVKRKKKTVKNSHVPFSIQPKLADYYIASDWSRGWSCHGLFFPTWLFQEVVVYKFHHSLYHIPSQQRPWWSWSATLERSIFKRLFLDTDVGRQRNVYCVYVSNYNCSGGHFNPAVTAGVCMAGGIGVGKAVLYFFAQIVGGLAGAGLSRVSLRHGTNRVILRHGTNRVNNNNNNDNVHL